MAGTVAVLLVAVLLVASDMPGYDTMFALAWGRDIAQGLPPNFSHPSSPTPHPLSVLGAVGLGYVPVAWSIGVTMAASAVAVLVTLVLLGYVAFRVSDSRIAAGAAMTCAAVSAAVGLLALNASSDVTYCAIALGGVLLTVHARHTSAVAVLMVAALLRPEAALFAAVPLVQSFLAHRAQSEGGQAARFTRSRTLWVYVVGLSVSVSAWLATGAAGGDPLIALNSASTNADINENPRGLLTALTDALPGLAGPTGWLTVGAATIAVVTTVWRRRPQHRTSRPRNPRTRPKAPVVPPGAASRQATLTVAIFIGVALLAFVGQGLLGTPLVARYLLLPALLSIALAVRCIPLAAKLFTRRRASTTAALTVAAALIVGAVVANVPAWEDVSYARETRTKAFSSAHELLDSELARGCDAPVVVRSPAMVAVTAIALERPLRDVIVADAAGEGVLLQPLTQEAAELAGYGPITPLAQQANFPTDAPPRHSNTHWALYSTCQP